MPHAARVARDDAVALRADATLRAADLELGPTRPDVRAGEVTVGAVIATYTVTVQPDDDLT